MASSEQSSRAPSDTGVLDAHGADGGSDRSTDHCWLIGTLVWFGWRCIGRFHGRDRVRVRRPLSLDRQYHREGGEGLHGERPHVHAWLWRGRGGEACVAGKFRLFFATARHLFGMKSWEVEHRERKALKRTHPQAMCELEIRADLFGQSRGRLPRQQRLLRMCKWHLSMCCRR